MVVVEVVVLLRVVVVEVVVLLAVAVVEVTGAPLQTQGPPPLFPFWTLPWIPVPWLAWWTSVPTQPR